MLVWRIYYGDETTYDNHDGGVETAPPFDVQAVACKVENPAAPHVYFRNDYYWWEAEEGLWRGGDIFGLFDYLQRPGWKKVLFGRTIRNDVYERVSSRAFHDEDFRID